MIADERADALVSNFTGQWLQLRNLESKVAPDLLMFPDFDDNIRKAFRRETELFFGHILRENRSALELLSADYTFVNERLAQALRHPGRLRRALPSGEADRSEPPRPARPRQHPVADVGGDADLAGVPRQVHPDDVPEHAAAAAAAERADARGKQQGRETRRRRCASSSSCTAATRSARPAIASSIRRASRSRTSTRSGSGASDDRNGAPIDTGGVLADGAKVDGPDCAAQCHPEPARCVRHRADRAADDLRARAAVSSRPTCRSFAASSRRRRQSNYRLASIVHEHRRERAVPDADQAGASRTHESRTVAGTPVSVPSGAAMIITKKHLSRRTFLRGTFGAAMALPMLDAMVPALTAQAQTAAKHAVPVRRRSTCRTACIPDTWHPATVGSDFEFKPVMQPLEGVPRSAGHGQQDEGAVGRVGPPRRELGVPERRRPGRRRATTPATPSARSSRRRRSTSTSPTRSPDDTPLRSIEVGTEDMGTAVGACDGFPCTFFNTLSWRDDFSPLPIGINPRVTFERMFGETGSTEQRTARLKEKQSLLDSVMAGDREAAQHARRARPRDPRRVSEQHPSGRAAARSHGDAARHDHRHAGSADRPARSVRRSHDGHLRPDAPGLPGRHQPRVHVHDRPRGERPRLRAHRHPRNAPQHLAPRQRRREAGEVREDRHLSDRQVQRVPRQAEGHARTATATCSITRCSTGAAA